MRGGMLIAVMVLAGCGGADDGPRPEGAVRYIDADRVETAIEESILASRDLDATVVCPTGVEQRKGLRFACLATLRDGTTNTFTVDQTDDDGNVTYEGR